MPKLRHLDLSGLQLRCTGGACAGTLVCENSTLEYLCLKRTPLGSEGTMAFCDNILARESSCSQRTHVNAVYLNQRRLSLDFSWCRIGEEAVCKLMNTLLPTSSTLLQSRRNWTLQTLKLQASIDGTNQKDFTDP